MVRLQEISIKKKLVRLLNLYQENDIGEMFARLVYKHNVYIPQELYLSAMDYSIEMSIDQHNKQLEDLIISINQAKSKAIRLSGAKNIFEYSSDMLLDQIVSEMDTHSLCCFFLEAIKVLKDKRIYFSDNYEQVIRGLEGVRKSDLELKELRCDLTEEELLLLRMEEVSREEGIDC